MTIGARNTKKNKSERGSNMGNITGQTSIDDFLGTLINQQPARKKKAAKPATSAITKGTRILSYKQTEKQPKRQLVVDVLSGRELTAREIAIEMHNLGLLPYPARAVIQPRITELVEDGVLEAVGTKYDQETERKVAVYKVV